MGDVPWPMKDQKYYGTPTPSDEMHKAARKKKTCQLTTETVYALFQQQTLFSLIPEHNGYPRYSCVPAES